MKALRQNLDDIDRAIIGLILERQQIVTQIGKRKRGDVIVPVETQRKTTIYVEALGELGGAIYSVLHTYSVKIQNEIY